ncbi:transposase [Streptomyces camelliae]|uniref:transposase n=1 Tax=Streptomyces camelliae TaxID=3004093 RepID=UPI003D16713C
MAAPRKYSDELRERAIREVRATGHPIAHVAKDLGIHKEALRGWVRQAEADRGERDDRLNSAEQDEVRQLRKEVAELRRANEILKAASVDSIDQRNRAVSLSAGVSKPRVLRGRMFSFCAMTSRSS